CHPEGFPGDPGALGAAAEGAGEARPAGGFPGGDFPGGDFPGGGRGLAPSVQPTGSRSEALATGIALLVLLAAAAFVAFFRRKRL
ncbi:CotH kinase family protein, partial [Paenibacillus barengoltzii]